MMRRFTKLKERIEDEDGLVRAFENFEGYDHVTGPPCASCVESERRCDHGRCAERWVFVVAQPGVAAVELVIATPHFPPETPRVIREGAEWYSHGLQYHSAWPQSKEQVLKGPGTDVCDFLLGGCYDGGWRSGEQEDGAHMDALLRTEEPLPQTKLWEWLRLDLAEKIERIEEARREDGDLRWVVCKCCEGEGALDKRKL